MKPERGDEALRRFRVSQPHTDYFLTFCTDGRKAGLTSPIVAGALRDEIRRIESDGHWTIRGAVIMPNHLHLLVTLHDKLPLSRVIARFKSKSRLALPVFPGRETTTNTACARRMPWSLFCSTFS